MDHCKFTFPVGTCRYSAAEVEGELRDKHLEFAFGLIDSPLSGRREMGMHTERAYSGVVLRKKAPQVLFPRAVSLSGAPVGIPQLPLSRFLVLGLKT